jgi:hypothetical protein
MKVLVGCERFGAVRDAFIAMSQYTVTLEKFGDDGEKIEEVM